MQERSLLNLDVTTNRFRQATPNFEGEAQNIHLREVSFHPHTTELEGSHMPSRQMLSHGCLKTFCGRDCMQIEGHSTTMWDTQVKMNSSTQFNRVQASGAKQMSILLYEGLCLFLF
jgi:hypothetical protein